ncbi:MAG: hypothetical protein MUF57_09145 [Gammaproteobacteria bacterium]|nr:hypothetical protein [Gammaproteobacteria bacterium]
MLHRPNWFVPALAALGGCALSPAEIPPPPAIVAAALPASRYTQQWLDHARAAAAWRPAALEHVLDLDGQRCAVVDLAVRCTLPALAATALAVDAATGATDPVTTDVDAVDSGSVE